SRVTVLPPLCRLTRLTRRPTLFPYTTLFRSPLQRPQPPPRSPAAGRAPQAEDRRPRARRRRGKALDGQQHPVFLSRHQHRRAWRRRARYIIGPPASMPFVSIMSSEKLLEFKNALDPHLSGDLRTDPMTRALYATDGSMYQKMPRAVLI